MIRHMIATAEQGASPTPGSSAAPSPGIRPAPLEFLAQERGPDEFLFFARGSGLADLGPVVGGELASAEALVFRLPASLLNPNYWQPHSRTAEGEVRDRMTGVITREEGGVTYLWRSDTIAPGRLLRDGLDVPVELLLGYVFKVRGRDLMKLAQAWAAQGESDQDRFEWIAFKALPSGEALVQTALEAHNDITAFRLRNPGELMAFAAAGGRGLRAIVRTRPLLRRCVGTLVVRYLKSLAGTQPAMPNDRICDRIIARANLGLTSYPDRDFVRKRTSFEFTAHAGRTEWSPTAAGHATEALEEKRVLFYYDRVAGIWDVEG
jgi:hypothetical protein